MAIISKFIVRHENYGNRNIQFVSEQIQEKSGCSRQVAPASPKGAYCWCSTTYVPVGDLDQSPLIKEPLTKSYASAGDQSTLFAIFSLSFGPFMQYAG